MKKNLFFNTRLLISFLCLSLGGFSAVFALDEEVDDDLGSLVDQIMRVNEEIEGLSSEETNAYFRANKDVSCKDNVTVLHNQFMDILAHYKPFKVTWENYNPIKNFKINPKNEDEQVALLKNMQGTKSELKNMLVQINKNITNCTPENYDFKTYKYVTYPVYSYSYPEYSSFYHPLLYGAGAWGLWSGWNAWNGWGGHHGWARRHHGWNRHHRWNRHHHGRHWNRHHNRGHRGGHHGGRHGGGHRGGHHGGGHHGGHHR